MKMLAPIIPGDDVGGYNLSVCVAMIIVSCHDDGGSDRSGLKDDDLYDNNVINFRFIFS